MSFHSSRYCEGCNRCDYWCGSTQSYYSESSFVDVMKREGLTDDDIFTACSYKRYLTSAGAAGWNGGIPYEDAESTQRDCVMEKFVAKLGQANWTFHTASKLTEYGRDGGDIASWHFTRQNATSS